MVYVSHSLPFWHLFAVVWSATHIFMSMKPIMKHHILLGSTICILTHIQMHACMPNTLEKHTFQKTFDGRFGWWQHVYTNFQSCSAPRHVYVTWRMIRKIVCCTCALSVLVLGVYVFVSSVRASSFIERQSISRSLNIYKTFGRLFYCAYGRVCVRMLVCLGCATDNACAHTCEFHKIKIRTYCHMGHGTREHILKSIGCSSIQKGESLSNTIWIQKRAPRVQRTVRRIPARQPNSCFRHSSF